MQRTGISHARLMRESTDRVERALHGDDHNEQLVASRIMETSGGFQRWESEHSQLMRSVADYSGLGNQVSALKRTTFSLIHGKALFEYLKTKEVRGPQRTNLVRHFYPTRGYTFAMVAEHGNYLRRSCSFLCASHVGTGVVRDEAFLDPLEHYEDLYAEYFDLYCRLQMSTDPVDSASEKSLLPLLKHQLGELRWQILNPREAAPRIRRDVELRRATGDTQVLPYLKFGFKRPALKNT
jgi:hypothetical protein